MLDNTSTSVKDNALNPAGDAVSTTGTEERFSRRRALLAGGLGTAAALSIGGLTLPDIAGATTTDVIHDQGGQVFNALAYNGGAFNSTTINAAISAASSAGGGIVFIPQGTWAITANLNITNDRIHLVGAGSATILEVQSSYTGDVITITRRTGCSVRNMMISAAGATARTAGSAIVIAGNKDNADNPANVVIEDVDMKYQYVGIYVGDSTTFGSWNVRINRGAYYDFANGGIGIYFNTTGGLLFVSDITVVGPAAYPSSQPLAGFRVQGAADLTMYGCVAIQCSHCLLIDPPNGATVAALFCDSCDWDTPGSNNAITITPASGGTAGELNFVNCWTNNSKAANGIYIGGNVNRVNFVGHRAYNNYTNGIWVSGGGAANVSIDSSEFSGNNVGLGGNAGIRLGTTGNSMSDVQVRNCRATGTIFIPSGGGNNQAYGIIVASGTNNYMIVGNNLRGNATGALSDSGGTNKVVANNLTT